MLVPHAWPGNVRELENMMKRVAALHAGDARVSSDALMPFLGQRTPRTNGGATPTNHEDDRTSILNAYAEARGNKSRVAILLGVSRKTLYARLKRLNLELP
jgi:transcriptional regulator of acetoin/glycerol metabolism